MKKLPITLAIAAITAGSAYAADITYSSENFEAGTPNYTINGINGTGVGQSWDRLESSPGVEIFPVDALVGTGYDSGSGSRNGVVANSEPTHFTPGGTIPSGQHGFVSTSQNRNLTSNYAMPLASDGVTSLDISLSYMFFSLSTDGNPVTAKGSAIMIYSALGDFSDGVQVASFGIGQAGSWVETPADSQVAQDTWTSVSVSITNGMSANSFTDHANGMTTPSTVVFTDTAAIRINRVPLVGLVSPDTPTNHVTFLDDITVTGVPGSAPAAPFAVTITPAVDPATGYDLQWPSQEGSTYDVRTSTDPATPTGTWTSVETGIAPTPPENTYNVQPDGVRRFYVIEEITP